MVERQTKSRARRLANAPIFGLTLGALISFAGAAVAAPALPTGGQVAAGSASIAKSSPSTLTIDQTSSRAIVTWSSFSIGQGGTVQFDNGAGATLNRVTGASLSSIDGLLSATGSVYLINPNGVILGKSGVVDTGGTFVASTQDLTNAEFMTGGTLTFSGNSTASVLNLGKIGSLGGDVALIASKVENDGTITASKGDVGLAAGYRVVMADATQNDGKFQVLVGGAGTSATNTGSIQAAEAELRANGGNVYALAGNTGGIIEATGVSANDGKVLLIAENGAVTANGTIEATGEVETSGETVNFAGLTVKAQNWLVDPEDLTISGADATTLSSTLNGDTSVTLETTSTTPTELGVSGLGTTSSGAGDIIIASPVSWGSFATLTLDAYHSITIDAPITVTGDGVVVLHTDYNNAGGGGGYGFGLTAAGFQGSLSFTSESSNPGLSINGSAYTLIYSMAELASELNNSSGTFALATSLTSGTDYASAVVATFGGTFTGLGHTITGLTINGSSADAGLFGEQTAGAIRDIGLVGGSVTESGADNVGDLVGGQLGGAIEDAYATGAVSAPDTNAVGGLVGDLNGSITDAYATGAVSGNFYVGGLVGYQSEGPITDAYATGAVSASGSNNGSVGGLVGDQSGSITDAYATGVVSGSSDVGGLVGLQTGGSITDGYYDASTTGQGSGSQSNGSVGMATAALQGTLPTFANALWSTGSGLYPYLTNFFPNGAQAISGFAYSDAGTTPLAGGSSIGALVNGAGLGAATTGANGYYYILTVAGGVPSGDSVLTYATNSLALTTSAGALNTSGLNLYGETLAVTTADTLYSEIPSELTAAINGNSAAVAALDGTTGTYLTAMGASFTFDEALTISGAIDVRTTAANAPVTVAEAITLNGTGSLGIDAAGALAIDAPITVNGTGAVNLTAGGGYGFDLTAAGFLGSLTFANTSNVLAINGTSYTLEATPAALVAAINADSSGNFALAASGNLGTSASAFIPSFSGNFTGLGHTITGMTIDDTSTNGDDGLFGAQSGGTIRDIGLVGGSVTANGTSVGDLVGVSNGSVTDAYATGAVSGDDDFVGGLVGLQSSGTITDAYATGAVSDTGGDGAGGLVGAQGLAGTNAITDAYATGAVSGGVQVGGLVGIQGVGGTNAITDAYATGAVSGSGGVGGLVGVEGSGTNTISYVYATGAVSGSSDIGGLVGIEGAGGTNTITDAYATGAVSAPGGVGVGVGGLVGSEGGGVNAITDAYATGAVSGSSDVGGIVGGQAAGGSDATVDGYYDAGTTGQALGVQSDGSVGLATAALQGSLPKFVNSGPWSTGPGLYPYLTNFFPNGVQAVSGFAFSDGGVTPATGTSVSAIADGNAFGSASVGANGYYYIFAPAGSATSGQGLLTYSAATDSATLSATTGATVQSGVDLYGSAMTVNTSATSLSTAPTLAEAQASGISADGGISAAATVIGDTTGQGFIASGASFTVDVAPAASLFLKTTAGSITLATPFTVTGSNYLTLDSFQSIAINDATTVSGGGAVDLVTNDGGSGGDYSVAGSLSFTSESSDPSLTINGARYTLVYSMTELASDLNGSTGDFALATSLTSSTNYTGAAVATFGGIFAGLNHSISDLTITGSNDDVGLFGTLDGGGEIRDFNLLGGSVAGGVGVGALVGNDEGQVRNVLSTTAVSGTSDVGGLVGYQASIGVVSSATTVDATVSGTSGVGGLVGKNSGTLLIAVSSDAVSGTRYVGGLVGYTTGAITGAGASGAVTGTGGEPAYIGGLAGYNGGNISFANAGTGNVSGTAYVGGLVGYNAATGTLSDDTTSGASVSGANVIGGLAGENLGTIESASSSSDAVSGTRYVGGLAGLSTGIITDASASGTVSGTTEVGGLVGYNSGNIGAASAATGNISGTTDVGGLAGYNGGNISSASATGSVTGTGGAPIDLGGLVGENGASGEIAGSQATGGAVSAPHGVWLGGLVGANAGEIGQSFATKTVGSSGSGSFQGGLVGYNTSGATIANTYATGQVEAGTDIGGLVGDNAGSVQTSWVSASVASGATSGGLAGANTGVFTNVYWDVGTTGLTSPLGVGILGASTDVTGIGGTTGKNADSQSTYAGFNFTSFWTIDPGASRPFLRNVTPQTPPN